MKVVALSGGIGGAKLALGLAHELAAEDLTLVANVADDFEHLGLTICPDIDTLTYTLAGLADDERGWGRRDETWSFMATLSQLGGADWFSLGDSDLALHVERTRRLRTGEPLSLVTADLSRRLGVRPRILPATDHRLRTVVQSDQGPLPFQHYFVRQRAEPRVYGFLFDGSEKAAAVPSVLRALTSADLVVICPSNPFISIEPILAVREIRSTLSSLSVPRIAVSPIVGGDALKGPTAKMMQELDLPVAPATVAARYRGLIDALVIDRQDEDAAGAVKALRIEALTADTVMRTLDDKRRLARSVLEIAQRL